MAITINDCDWPDALTQVLLYLYSRHLPLMLRESMVEKQYFFQTSSPLRYADLTYYYSLQTFTFCSLIRAAKSLSCAPLGALNIPISDLLLCLIYFLIQ